jgi:hypothetical protein
MIITGTVRFLFSPIIFQSKTDFCPGGLRQEKEQEKNTTTPTRHDTTVRYNPRQIDNRDTFRAQQWPNQKMSLQERDGLFRIVKVCRIAAHVASYALIPM